MFTHLRMTNFGNHQQTDVTLAAPGITVFVGQNGAGKSMVSEAISWCLFGKYIRAKQGWSPVDVGSTVTLESTQNMVFCRKSLSSGSKFIAGNTSMSTREANAYVAKKFEDHPTFLRSHVFKRSLLVRFSTAGDAERKTIIENLLGLDEFSSRYSHLRSRLPDVKYAVVNAEDKLEETERRLYNLRLDLSRIKKPKQPLYRSVRKAKKELVRLEKEYNAWRKSPLEEPSDTALYEAESKVSKAAALYDSVIGRVKEVESLISQGKCPTCGADTERRDLKKNARLLRKQASSCNSELLALRKNLETERTKLRHAQADYEQAKHYERLLLHDIDKRSTFINQSRDAISQYKKDLAYYKEERERLMIAIREAEADLDILHVQLVTARNRLQRLEDLLTVYAPRGARVYMLSDALTSIGNMATSMLRSLYDQRVSVAVEPTDDLGRIRLVIMRPDGDTMTHRGSSEGECVLLDFVLLKVLAAISARSEMLPLYIYDDLLDALDVENAGRVVEYLEAESKTVQVLLFTHDDGIIDRLPTSRIYRVKDGECELIQHERISK